jgi:hypothetical protein
MAISVAFSLNTGPVIGTFSVPIYWNHCITECSSTLCDETVIPFPFLLMSHIYILLQVQRHFPCLRSFQSIRPILRPFVTFRNVLIFFYGGELLAPRPTTKLEGHPLSAVRDCLLNIFAATLHIWRPSTPSATWGRAMPWWQGTHLTWNRIWGCGLDSLGSG